MPALLPSDVVWLDPLANSPYKLNINEVMPPPEGEASWNIHSVR